MKWFTKGTTLYGIMFVIVFFTCCHPVNATVDFDKMGHQLNDVLKTDPNLTGSVAGISIRHGATGEIIYEHQGNVRLRPASNMKLVTAAVALSVLGENYTFKTELLTSGHQKGKQLQGDLFLKGYGDPTLLKRDIDYFAKNLKDKGVKIVEGDLIADDTWYDDTRYSKDLPWSDEQAYYGAQVSALTVSPDKDFDTGSIIIKVDPGHNVGSIGEVKVLPKTKYVKIINRTKTVQSDGRKKVVITREHATNTIILKGTIPIKSTPYKETIAVWNPTEYASSLFVQSLNRHGIKVKGKVKTGATPKEAELLIVHKSKPLKDILMPFMKLSNNGHGEMLMKEMGKVVSKKGSWDHGLDVVESEIVKLGLNSQTMVLRDGSGVSHVTLIPANEISKLLYMVQKKDWFPSFLQSLPVNGSKNKMMGGTLRYRMKSLPPGTEVKAKTGTLTTVSSISGYVKTQTGETLIFSILLNNLMDEKKAKTTEDRMISILANL